ncbi:MAG: JAB domain-containing protein [bacterium]|nr:JAB domain-containing protein [bacterium]
MKLIREINDNYKITEPEHTLKYLKEFQKEDREFFIVLGLDTQNKVLYRDVVSIGTLNCILIHPREVFKSAIMKSVNSIIIAHNHPSGSQDPSKEDLEVLETLKSGADILDIKILDALIITSEGVFSFKGFKEVF